MREKKKELTTWIKLKTWMKKRYTTTCSSTESKTQEKKSNDGIFWDVNRERSQRDNELRSINTIAEADIIRTELLSERDVRRLRTN